MNLNRYIDNYGNYSFAEVPFNEVDNVLFAYLSYLNLEPYVSKSQFSPRTIRDVGDDFFKNYSKKERYVYATRKAIKLLRNIKDTKRYSNLLLYNYVYESGNEEQFSAFTIEINKGLVYVSFEGTDQLVSGWKEDFMFSYKFPTVSQKKAIRYVNNRLFFSRKKIILGGHSKGGNLAIVAGMYANYFVKKRIISIYNNDGPGFLKEKIESRQYRSISDRLVNIIPNYSIVGILLYHENICVVRSMKKGVFSHDVMSWVVKDNSFERCELSLYSERLHNKLMEWLDKYDLVTREKFVISLFAVFDRAGVINITDIYDNKKLILKLILETKGIDSDIKKMIRDFILVVFKVSNEVRLDEIKMMFQKKAKESI